MATMRNLSGKQVVEILRQHGFRDGWRRGPLMAMHKTISGQEITVAVPDQPVLSMSTLMLIVGQSRIAKEYFEPNPPPPPNLPPPITPRHKQTPKLFLKAPTAQRPGDLPPGFRPKDRGR